ncbi:AAA family ATPase, partial [Vibrio splendidus]|uniref:AAA family ATPase n=1 Tax=Vibrio splendidus TaxID=29497 RepID=UPI003D1015E7
NVGLLTTLNIDEIQNLQKNETSVLNFINLYIEDSKEKLKPYDEIYKQLFLFLKTTNARLKHKKISACMDHGFKIQSTILTDEEDKPLEFSFEKLSSGEQHEIILFYKLIFLYDNGSMVLIDEPELSLHISWQNNFINDIKEIISQKDLSVVIATHSPDLIGAHWNLTQKLTGVDI